MKNKTELGQRKQYPSLRQGIDGTRLRGMQRRPDASAVPDEAFEELINARVTARGIECRGGQSKVNSAATTSGCPELIFDAGDIGVPRYTNGFYAIGNTDASFDHGLVAHLNPANGVDTRQIVLIPGDPVLVFWSIAYVPEHTCLYVMQEGSTSGPNDVKIYRLPIGGTAITQIAGVAPISSSCGGDMCAFDGDLFFAVTRTVGSVAISTNVYRMTDDGTLTVDDTVSNVTGGHFATFGDDLYVGYSQYSGDAGNALVRKRVAGVWSSLGTLPVAALRISSMVEYDGELWIAAHTSAFTNLYLISCNGTAFTLERTIAIDGFGGNGAVLGVFNSCLYYGYNGSNPAPQTTGYLGKYDGVTFTDEEYSRERWTPILVSSWHDELYIPGSFHTSETEFPLLKSNGTDTTTFSTAASPFTGEQSVLIGTQAVLVP